MLEYSKVLQERKLTDNDVNKWADCNSFKIEKCKSLFDYVKAGECVVKLTKRYDDSTSIDICADTNGYVRFGQDTSVKKRGDVLFYILETDDLKFKNWDLSQLRIEYEVIDEKYYYSLCGMPKEPVVDLASVCCSIYVTADDPTWTIQCQVFNMYETSHLHPVSSEMKVVSKEEPFRVKLKDGSKISNYYVNHFYYSKGWEDEDDGKHCRIKYFAIGYPKKSQLAKEAIRTMATQETVPSSDEACYVYVMRNNVNRAYKIGISKSPEYREHTLQSQEPDVTCIFQLEFPSRDIARAVEREMHDKYAEYRLRGEWFSIPRELIYSVMGDIVQYGKDPMK